MAADARPFVSAGMPPYQATEVAEQIGGTGNAVNFVRVGLPTPLASELARQITAGVGDAQALIAVGAPSGLAGVLSTAIGAVAPSVPFSLSQLPSASRLGRWDASVPASITLAGSQVSAFADQFSGLTFAQATAGMRPTYNATGWDGALPAISFDGNFNSGQGDILTLVASLAERYWVFALIERGTQNNGAGSNPKSILQVFRPSDGLFASLAFLRPNADAGQTVVMTTGWGTSSNTVAAPGGGLANGVKGLVFADMGKAIAINSGTLGTITNVGAGTKAEIALGGDSAVDHNRGAFKLAELLIVDPLHFKGDGADNQRWVIEGWLMHKWGLAGLLPALHPFRLAPPLASDWTGNAREVWMIGNSLCLGWATSVPQAWSVGYLTTPPLTNSGVGGDTSTQIRTRFDAANPRLYECIVGIGEMYTNGNGGGGNPTTREHIDHMVATVLAAGGKPIVFDWHVNNSPAWEYGQSARVTAEAENASLQAAYPDYFLNVSEFVRQLGAPGGPYEDSVNYAKGLPPAAAMADNTHYIADVYTRIGRDCIGAFIKAKGWDR